MIPYVFQKYPENFTFLLFITLQNFNSFYIVISVYKKKTLRLNNLKIKTALSMKISVFVIFVEEILYLLLYNLYDCAFKTIIKTIIAVLRSYSKND